MRIGITLGDVTGVGPEVALKAVAAESKNDDNQYEFIGDENILFRLNDKLPTPLPLIALPESDRSNRQSEIRNARSQGRFFITNPFQRKLPSKLPAGSTIAARAAMAALLDGAKCCLRGELAALVTGPVNKEAIIRAGHKDFVGQTEFLSGLAGAKRTAMMLLGRDDR
ncbi:MAG: 4-hydroxythreonine-4-phosphate dehydrogenase PdxA, partial [Limisphaerales bacterium]